MSRNDAMNGTRLRKFGTQRGGTRTGLQRALAVVVGTGLVALLAAPTAAMAVTPGVTPDTGPTSGGTEVTVQLPLDGLAFTDASSGAVAMYAKDNDGFVWWPFALAALLLAFGLSTMGASARARKRLEAE